MAGLLTVALVVGAVLGVRWWHGGAKYRADEFAESVRTMPGVATVRVDNATDGGHAAPRVLEVRAAEDIAVPDLRVLMTRLDGRLQDVGLAEVTLKLGSAAISRPAGDTVGGMDSASAAYLLALRGLPGMRVQIRGSGGPTALEVLAPGSNPTAAAAAVTRALDHTSATPDYLDTMVAISTKTSGSGGSRPDQVTTQQTVWINRSRDDEATWGDIHERIVALRPAAEHIDVIDFRLGLVLRTRVGPSPTLNRLVRAGKQALEIGPKDGIGTLTVLHASGRLEASAHDGADPVTNSR